MKLLFLECIARMEGLHVTGSRPQINNNPGDLEYHGWEAIYGGSLGSDLRFAKFPSVDQGYQALRHLFTFPLYFGKTLAVAFNTYAPSGENQTNVYLKNVCEWGGFTADTIITIDLLTLPTGE